MKDNTKINVSSDSYWIKRKDEGLCVGCSKPIDSPSSPRCASCRLKQAEYFKRRKAKLLAAASCIYCARPLTLIKGKMACAACRARHLRNKHERELERIKLNMCRVCGKNKVSGGTGRGSTVCSSCKQKASDYQDSTRNSEKRRKNHLELKARVFDHYGSTCICCGESDKRFLSIDHTNNDGYAHRAKLGTKVRGSNLYRWIVKHDYPSDLQVMCFNCNMGRAINGGICPHKEYNDPVKS